MPKLICHAERMTCKCGNELDEVPSTTSTRSRFSFDITHKRDGTPIKNLEKEGAFLGVIELGWCSVCEDYCAVLDTEENQETWSNLPKFNQPQ